MSLLQVWIAVTKSQLHSIASATQNGHELSLKLPANTFGFQAFQGGHQMLVNKAAYNKLASAANKGKGTIIKLSAKVLRANAKHGSGIWDTVKKFALPALAGLAIHLVGKLFGSKDEKKTDGAPAPSMLDTAHQMYQQYVPQNIRQYTDDYIPHVRGAIDTFRGRRRRGDDEDDDIPAPPPLPKKKAPKAEPEDTGSGFYTFGNDPRGRGLYTFGTGRRVRGGCNACGRR